MLSESYESCKFWVLCIQSNFVSLILSPVQFCKKTQVTYEASQHNTITTAWNPVIHIIMPLGKHRRILGAIIEDLDDKYISPPWGEGQLEETLRDPAQHWSGPSKAQKPKVLHMAPHLMVTLHMAPPYDYPPWTKSKRRRRPSQRGGEE